MCILESKILDFNLQPFTGQLGVQLPADPQGGVMNTCRVACQPHANDMLQNLRWTWC